MRAWLSAAVALWALAEASILTLVGSRAWPVALGWAGAAAAVGLLGLATRRRGLRVFGAACLPPLLVLLTWEGGLFFVPASLALLVAAALAGPAGRADGPGPRCFGLRAGRGGT